VLLRFGNHHQAVRRGQVPTRREYKNRHLRLAPWARKGKQVTHTYTHTQTQTTPHNTLQEQHHKHKRPHKKKKPSHSDSSLGVILVIIRGCVERCCSNNKTPNTASVLLNVKAVRRGQVMQNYLAVTRCCYYQYCMVYGIHKGGRGGVVYCAIDVQ